MIKQSTSDHYHYNLNTSNKYQYTVLLGPRFNTSVRQNEQDVVLDRFDRGRLLRHGHADTHNEHALRRLRRPYEESGPAVGVGRVALLLYSILDRRDDGVDVG